MKKNDIGLIGLGNMGKNIAENILNKNYNLSIYNRTYDKLHDFELNYINNDKKKKFNCFSNIKDFIISLKIPRKIFIIISSGKCIDELINSFINYLIDDDIIIDLSNSFYKDSIKRSIWLSKFNINFLDIGISGGIKGALNGLSMMISGNKKNSFEIIKPILKKISHKKNNKSYIRYLGKNGIGHYIKMIHNSIEYTNMQLISEIYLILKNIFCISNDKIGNIFSNWNNSILKSYLLKISSNILLKKDKYNNNILDKISDEARDKETTKWSVKNSLDIKEFSILPALSLFIRYISCKKNDRNEIYNIFNNKNNNNNNNINNKYKLSNYLIKLKKSLYLCNIFSYIQGFSQIENMSKIMNWNLKYDYITKILNFGTIIESKLLEKIYKFNKIIKEINYIKLLFFFKKIIYLYQKDLRKIVTMSIKNKIPILVLSSSLEYYDIISCNELSTKLIQAQRDYFGHHMSKLIDKNEDLFHIEWN